MSFLTVVICDNVGCTNRVESRTPSSVYEKIKNWLEVKDTQTPDVYHFCPTHAPKKG